MASETGFFDWLGQVTDTAGGIFDKVIDYENANSEKQNAQEMAGWYQELIGTREAHAAATTNGAVATASTNYTPLLIAAGVGVVLLLALKK